MSGGLLLTLILFCSASGPTVAPNPPQYLAIAPQSCTEAQPFRSFLKALICQLDVLGFSDFPERSGMSSMSVLKFDWLVMLSLIL